MWGKRLNRWNTIPMPLRCFATSRGVHFEDPVLALRVADQFASHGDPAAVDPFQVVDAAQEGGLAGAGRAEEAHDFAGVDEREMPFSTATPP